MVCIHIGCPYSEMVIPIGITIWTHPLSIE